MQPCCFVWWHCFDLYSGDFIKQTIFKIDPTNYSWTLPLKDKRQDGKVYLYIKVRLQVRFLLFAFFLLVFALHIVLSEFVVYFLLPLFFLFVQRCSLLKKWMTPRNNIVWLCHCNNTYGVFLLTFMYAMDSFKDD